jgi:glucose-6-phosphate isomerase
MPAPALSASLTRSPAWRALTAHRRAWNTLHLRDLFAADPGRFARFSLEAGGLFLDYSKNLIIDETRDLLVQLARQRGLPENVAALLAGKRVNSTEKRAAWHSALRAGKAAPREVKRSLDAMRRFSEALRAAQVRGAGGQPITDVVSLGIGGSALGPALVANACAPDAGAPRVHFVTTPGDQLSRQLAALDPATTLFIVQSKSFSTMETMRNAEAARAWLKAAGIADCAPHLAAVTAATDAATAFGVAAERVFPLWDWVGGRYSVWSAVGLPAMIAMGAAAFDEFLAGAAAMDAHFAEAPPERNMPMLMALLGIWHGNGFGAASRAVISYEPALKLLPPYLQQLEMESLGKSVTRKGKPLRTGSSAIVWGGLGVDAQHAYMQALHQGTQLVPVDFIAACSPRHGDSETHALTLANCFSQSALLMRGVTTDEALEASLAANVAATDAKRLAPHQTLPGNRPSNTLLLPALTPHSLGALLALYEHRTFAQAALWDINAFDQYGVEHGKRLAGALLPGLSGISKTAAADASTDGLIQHSIAHNRRSQ